MKHWKKQLSAALAAGMCALVPISVLADTGSPVVLSGQVVSVSNCTVTVIVTDQNGNALAGASVTLDQAVLITGTDGNVLFDGLDLGERHRIEARKSGYSAASQEYYVEEDDGTVTLTLRRHSSGGGGNSGKGSSAAQTEEGFGPGNPSRPEESPDQPAPDGTGQAQPPSDPGRQEVSDIPDEPGTSLSPDDTFSGSQEKNPQETEAQKDKTLNQGEPIIISSPPGVGAVQIKDQVVGESIDKNAAVVVELTASDGSLVSLSLPPFTDHDRNLYGNNELWVFSREEGAQLVIQVPERRDMGESEVFVPHNYSEAAVQWPADIRVVIQGTDEEYLLPSGLFSHDTYGRLDFGVEHDYGTGRTSLLYTLKGSHAQRSLMVPEGAFQYAAENRMPLKARIYNPEDKDELWYEWSFTPREADGLTAADTDLYIASELPEGDGLRTYLWWRHSQPLSISHHGPLPDRATLRIRNQFGFKNGEKVDFMTLDKDGGRNVLHRALLFDEDGFVTIGDMTHCSSYALAGNLWWWVIAVPAALIALLAGLLWLAWHKRHEDTR